MNNIYDEGKTVPHEFRNFTLHELEVKDRDEIIAFMKGAILSWCVNTPEKWFSTTILFGGENREWKNTPLQKLWETYYDRNSPDPESAAGLACGHYFVKALNGLPSRTFVTRDARPAREYKLTQNS